MNSNIVLIIVKEIKRKEMNKNIEKRKIGAVTGRNQDLNPNFALAGGVRQMNPKSRGHR